MLPAVAADCAACAPDVGPSAGASWADESATCAPASELGASPAASGRTAARFTAASTSNDDEKRSCSCNGRKHAGGCQAGEPGTTGVLCHWIVSYACEHQKTTHCRSARRWRRSSPSPGCSAPRTSQSSSALRMCTCPAAGCHCSGLHTAEPWMNCCVIKARVALHIKLLDATSRRPSHAL